MGAGRGAGWGGAARVDRGAPRARVPPSPPSLPRSYWTQSVAFNVTLEGNTLLGCGCAPLVAHAIEYNPDIVGLVLVNNTVTPPQCT